MSESKLNQENVFYTLLTAGQKVRLDKGFRNSSIVTVLGQSSKRMYTTVFTEGCEPWDVMTNRLTPCG